MQCTLTHLYVWLFHLAEQGRAFILSGTVIHRVDNIQNLRVYLTSTLDFVFQDMQLELWVSLVELVTILFRLPVGEHSI